MCETHLLLVCDSSYRIDLGTVTYNIGRMYQLSMKIRSQAEAARNEEASTLVLRVT